MERITDPWERISHFVIMFYYCIIFKNSHVPWGISFCSWYSILCVDFINYVCILPFVSEIVMYILYLWEVSVIFAIFNLVCPLHCKLFLNMCSIHHVILIILLSKSLKIKYHVQFQKRNDTKVENSMRGIEEWGNGLLIFMNISISKFFGGHIRQNIYGRRIEKHCCFCCCCKRVHASAIVGMQFVCLFVCLSIIYLFLLRI